LRAPKKNVLKSIVTASSEGRNVREEKKEKKCTRSKKHPA
jgi:hypothetical protein